MISLKNIVCEILLKETEEVDISEPTIIGEAGYEYLKKMIEDLNKKAIKYRVPLMELQVVKEEFVKEKKAINFITGLPAKSANDVDVEWRDVTLKKYHVRINGNPPQIDGYEFIAKVEHTEAGNLLNLNPKSSIKNLPSQYVTAAQRCDVCHTQRDRNNTYVLKMERDDPERFPGKKKDDLLMIGSSCLKRFLPEISIDTLTHYAEFIDLLRQSVSHAEEMDDSYEGGGGGSYNYIEKKSLIYFIAANYIYKGKYISKKKAQEFLSSSTVDDALTSMHPPRGYTNPVLEKLRNDATFKQRTESMLKEYEQWEKDTDFDQLAANKPEFSSFYTNCKVLTKLENIKYNNTNKIGAMFGMFLYDKGQIEKKAAQAKAGEGMTYIGNVGEKVKMKVTVGRIKSYEGQYGTGLIVNMVGETKEADGNIKRGNITYFTSNFGLEEGEEAEVEATIKGQSMSKYTNLPDTQITRAKILNFITHPEKNAGKEKIKEWTGTVTFRLSERTDYTLGKPIYVISGNVDTKTHPDMNALYNNWGVGFSYSTYDATDVSQLKQYDGQPVRVKMIFARAMKLDDWKSKDAVLKSISIVN